MRRASALLCAVGLFFVALDGAVADTVKIALVAPLSGPDAVFGAQLKLGITAAIDDMNAAGGLFDQKAELVLADDHNDPKRGIETARHLIEQHVGFVIGDFSSLVTVAASDVYAAAGVLQITPSATAPLVTERGLPLLFRLGNREDQQAATIAHFLTARHYTRIALVRDGTGFSKAFADAVRAQLTDAHLDEAFYGSLAGEGANLAALVARVKASGAQALVWTGSAAGAALLARQLHETNIKLIGGLAMASDDFANLAGPSASSALVVFPQDPRQNPAAAQLLHRLEQSGEEPYGYAFYAYAAVEILTQAAKSAHSIDPRRIAAIMHEHTTFKTVIGSIAFDKNGDATPSDLTIFVWQKGPTGRMTLATRAAF
jgi:branched-chain amino acid transport system substrate-binding protein